MVRSNPRWRTGQGRRIRIDHPYATADVADALTPLEVIDDEDVKAVSDHALALARFDLTILREVLTPATTRTP